MSYPSTAAIPSRQERDLCIAVDLYSLCRAFSPRERAEIYKIWRAAHGASCPNPSITVRIAQRDLGPLGKLLALQGRL